MTNYWLDKGMECINFIEGTYYLTGEGYKPFRLYDYQKRYINFIENNNFIITKKFRQGGFTTLALYWAIWKCITIPNYRAFFCVERERIVNDLNGLYLDKERLPGWKSFLTKSNDHEKHFKNGSYLYIGKPEVGCGKALDCLVLDEAAFIEDAKLHWTALYPCLKKDSTCIVQSTPFYAKGLYNWFEDTYLNDGFSKFECSIAEHPIYRLPGWAEMTKKNLGNIGWQLEYEAKFLSEIN